MSDDKNFQLLKNTLEGKVKNIDVIPHRSKASLIAALDNASNINDLIGINKAILHLINKA